MQQGARAAAVSGRAAGSIVVLGDIFRDTLVRLVPSTGDAPVAAEGSVREGAGTADEGKTARVADQDPNDIVTRFPFQRLWGGSGLNTARALVQALASTAAPEREEDDDEDESDVLLLSAVGSEEDGRDVHTWLQDRGVRSVDSTGQETVLVVTDGTAEEGRRTGECLVVSDGPERKFVTYRGLVGEMEIDWWGGANGIVDLLTPPTPSAKEQPLRRHQHLHVSGFFNLTKLRSQVRALFEEAQRRRSDANPITTSVNLQWDATAVWDCQGCLALSTVCFANADEAMGVTRMDNARDAAISLVQDHGVQVATVTVGADGVWLATTADDAATAATGGPAGARCSDAPIRVHTWSGFEVVDATGAGDQFAAGFLAEFARRGGSLEWDALECCCRLGCAAGAAAVTVTGGSTAPTSATWQCALNQAYITT